MLAQLVGERFVEQTEKRLWSRRRQVARRQNFHLEVQPVAREIDDFLRGVRLRQVAVDFDQGRDIACRRLRKAPCHGLPMPLHEGKCNDALKNDDRRDDDEKRTCIESLRQDLADDVEQAHDMRMLTEAAIARLSAVGVRRRLVHNRHCRFSPFAFREMKRLSHGQSV